MIVQRKAYDGHRKGHGPESRTIDSSVCGLLDSALCILAIVYTINDINLFLYCLYLFSPYVLYLIRLVLTCNFKHDNLMMNEYRQSNTHDYII